MNMKKKYIVLSFLPLLLLLIMVFLPTVTYAAEGTNLTQTILINPLGGTADSKKGVTSIPLILGGILQQVLTILGALALVAAIIAGFYWLISAGNAEKVKKGRDSLVYAAIGLFVVFASYGILSSVLNGLKVNQSASLELGAEEDTAAGYYKIVAEKGKEKKAVEVWKKAQKNVPLAFTVSHDTPCVEATGKDSGEYVEVKNPNKDKDTGWILRARLEPMSADECKKGSAVGVLTCEEPTSIWVNTVTDGTGLSIRKEAKATGEKIRTMIDGAEFLMCANRTKQGWSTIKYHDVVGYADAFNYAKPKK